MNPVSRTTLASLRKAVNVTLHSTYCAHRPYSDVRKEANSRSVRSSSDRRRQSSVLKNTTYYPHDVSRKECPVRQGIHGESANSYIPSKHTPLGRPLRAGRSWEDTKKVQRPTDAHREAIRRVSGAIRRRFGSTYSVEPFGSTVYMRGFDVDTLRLGQADIEGSQKPLKGDLDLVVLDSVRPLGFTPDVDTKNLPAIYNIRRLAAVLSRAGFTDVQSVPVASVPIVKFRDPRTQLSLDINVNDRLGLINSHLLRSYCDALPGLRTLLVAIKLWAQPLGLNSPSTARSMVTFSTYALALMTLGWLQSRGLAPNLQGGLEGVPQANGEGTFWIRNSPRKKDALHIECDVRFRLVMAWDRKPPLPLRETLIDWFQFWGYVFDFEHQAIDVKEGGVCVRPDAMEDKAQLPDNPVCVMDPFIRSKNVTKGISREARNLFSTQCRLELDGITEGLSMNEIIKGYDLLEQL